MREKDVKAQVSASEWNIRVNLAACARALSYFEIEEFGYNHLFARTDDNHVLVPPFGVAYEEIRASDFIKVNFAGKTIFNPHNDISFGKALLQHLPILERRPTIKCLLHTHSPAGTPISMLECGLLPYTQSAMRFAGIPHFEFTGNIIGTEDIDLFMQCMGNHDSIILRNHGLLVVGTGIPQAFNTLFFLEQACRWQLKAQACNTPLFVPTDAAIQKTKYFFSPEFRKSLPGPDGVEMGVKEWPTILRLMDRKDPKFRL
jgi:ribulose-5-phosphate 4-epimerase/fuculose-1-phosphate aldolase